MKPTHYETLGVDPKATADEIKRAYRAQAKVKHPDKGGSQTEFQPIAHAYEVLRNSERRQLYDATGRDERDPIEVEVQNLLIQAFSEAFSAATDVNVVKIIRQTFKDARSGIAARRKQLEARKTKLETRRDGIKSTAAVNVAHLVIDQELKNIESELAMLDHHQNVGKACLDALATYTDDWAPPRMGKPFPHSFEFVMTGSKF